MRTRLSRVPLVVLAVCLIAAGCTQPAGQTIVKPEPTWVPPNPISPNFPYARGDAAQLVNDLRAKFNDRAFAESLDPSTRDETLNSIAQLLADPVIAEQTATEFIDAQLSGQESYAASGTLPAPLTAADKAAAGAPQDLVDGAPDDPPVTDPPADPPPPAEPAGSTTVNLSGPDLPESTDPPTSLSVVPTGETFPGGTARNSWPVYGGERADALGALVRSGSAEDPEPASTTCNSQNTGPRLSPPAIPSFESVMFTPPQDSWMIYDKTGYLPVLRDSNDPDSAPVVRYNTSLNPPQWQLKVESHLLSPTYDSLHQRMMVIGDLRGMIHLEQLGKPIRTFTASNPEVEWHTYCYLDDLNQSAERGYVEAWIPIGRGLDPARPIIREPGLQVRFESIDNYWNGSAPSAFYAAAQHTVHSTSNGPKAHDAPVSGAAGVRVDDGVIVDRDGNPNNDLESILTTRVVSTLEAAFNSLQGQNYWGWAYVLMGDVDPNNISMDMDIQPINATESKFTASVDVWDLWFRGWVGAISLPCYVQSHIAGHVTISGVIDVGNPDRTKLAPRILTTSVGGLSHWGTYMNVLRPVCNFFYAGLSAITSDLFTYALNNKINDQIRDRVREPLQANTQSIVGPGVTLAGGGGFHFTFPGFQPTCSYNCAGGTERLDANGLHIAVEAGADDLKPSTDPRRFPWVFDPVAGTSPLTYTTTSPSGAAYDIGVFLHPTLLNEILRSLTEGGPGQTPNGLLDLSSSGGSGLQVHPEVAPIFVDQPPVPSQVLPAFTVFVPDLRVTDSSGNAFAVNAAVGIDLTVNASTRKLIPSIQVYVDVDALKCSYSILYSLCANSDWQGGAGSLIPSVPALINWTVNTVVPPLLSNSLGEVEIPPINGFDPLVLGNIEIRRNGGTLAIYVGT